jgi:hypothetical protein
MTITIETIRISRMIARLEYYPDNLVVRVDWHDGDFSLLLVKELRVALRTGKVFDRAAEQIASFRCESEMGSVDRR